MDFRISGPLLKPETSIVVKKICRKAPKNHRSGGRLKNWTLQNFRYIYGLSKLAIHPKSYRGENNKLEFVAATLQKTILQQKIIETRWNGQNQIEMLNT